MTTNQPTRGNILNFDPDDLVIIGLDTEDDEKHPLWDKRIKLPVDEALAANIRVVGVHTPIRVRKNGERYEVVAGRQRVRSARLAKAQQKKHGEVEVKVPAMVSRGEDVDLMGIMISENELRRNGTPLDRAKTAQRYLDMGANEDQVCNVFGIKAATLQDWLTLLELAPAIRKAVDTGVMSASAASTLAGQSHEQQVEHLEALKAEGAKPTADNLENKVRQSQGKAPYVTSKQRIDDALAAMVKFHDDPATTKGEVREWLEKLAGKLGRKAEFMKEVNADGGN